jgi:hypothetical protein
MKRRILLPLGLAALAMALALIAGAQLPQRALPVVLGVIAGVAASVPTSLIIVWRVTKAAPRPAPGPAAYAPNRPPTVIVVRPEAAPATPAPAATAPPARAPAALARETRPVAIIGGQDEA